MRSKAETAALILLGDCACGFVADQFSVGAQNVAAPCARCGLRHIYDND